jgi:hypothetical protein
MTLGILLNFKAINLDIIIVVVIGIVVYNYLQDKSKKLVIDIILPPIDSFLQKLFHLSCKVFVFGVIAFVSYSIIVITSWWAILVLPATAILVLYIMKAKKLIIPFADPILARVDKIIAKFKL